VSTTLALVTTFWGLLMGLAPLLQVRVIVREKDATGTSVAWISILLVGFLLWLAYGIVQRDVPLILSNIVAATVTTTLLVTIGVYRRRGGVPVPRGACRTLEE
jgi:uncharacterized protein with PQ loop repeat